jgi:heat shock protein 4
MEDLKVIGVDIGAQNTILCDDNAELVLTSTGGVSRPTIISFQGRSRLIDEEALPQINSPDTVPTIGCLIGLTQKELASRHAYQFISGVVAAEGTKSEDALGSLVVRYRGRPTGFSTTALLATYISKVWGRLQEVHGECRVSFALPQDASEAKKTAYMQAAQIAGINPNRLSLCRSDDAIVAAYARKLRGIGASAVPDSGPELALIFEMGHAQLSTVLCSVEASSSGVGASGSNGGTTNLTSPIVVRKLVSYQNIQLGSSAFDHELFHHFSEECGAPSPSSKRALRLLAGCEKLRKLLSQVHDACVTVENAKEDGDATLKMNRTELKERGRDLLSAIAAQVRVTIAEGRADAIDIRRIELTGGGSRMQVVQDALTEIFPSLSFGAKLDDSTLAVGAALLESERLATATASTTTTPINDDGDGDEPALSSEPNEAAAAISAITVSTDPCLSVAELEEAVASEKVMREHDAELVQILATRNKLEAYLLECRARFHHEHAPLIETRQEIEKELSESEEFLWDFDDNVQDAAAKLEAKYVEVKGSIDPQCELFLLAVKNEQTIRNQEIMQAAYEGDMERQEAELRTVNGTEDPNNAVQDHDTRKLKKPEVKVHFAFLSLFFYS